MKIFLSSILLVLASCANSQTNENKNIRLVGGNCEGCEAVLEYGDQKLNAVDTLPDFNDKGTKIKVTGTIYEPDGKTPAEGVILYVYHTDQTGVYPTKGDEEGWAKRHGYIRGWVKTDEDGKYTFYTLKPGVYPNRTAAAHIHPTILEPDGRYYWLDSYLFKDDPLLSDREKNQSAPRGGSDGILELKKEGNILVGKRDIVLGKNIQGYDK